MIMNGKRDDLAAGFGIRVLCRQTVFKKLSRCLKYVSWLIDHASRQPTQRSCEQQLPAMHPPRPETQPDAIRSTGEAAHNEHF